MNNIALTKAQEHDLAIIKKTRFSCQKKANKKASADVAGYWFNGENIEDFSSNNIKAMDSIQITSLGIFTQKKDVAVLLIYAGFMFLGDSMIPEINSNYDA
jgi:hypothetical protein